MPNATKLNGELTHLSQGIFAQIRARLEKRNAVSGLSFGDEDLKAVLNDMVVESGADILFHAYLSAVDKEGDRIRSISVATRSGIMQIEADYFIDATGDAQTAYLAGCPTVLGREDGLCQPMTLCFRVGGVDTDAFYASKKRLDSAHKCALERGEFINPRENILVFQMLNKGVLHFNTTRVVKLNPTDPQDVTKAELIARKQVDEIYEFMKKQADGLENSFLLSTASEIGVRESRKIVGDYVLTGQDCKNCVKFEDAICACNYEIDIHNPEGTGTSHYFFAEGEYYTVPYRSLIPQGVQNMLVAGRCISSDHSAQASYRIMPTVCTIGEATGVAVALASKNGCSTREICVADLQKRLVENGAFIGV
jgi:hypothetical protein